LLAFFNRIANPRWAFVLFGKLYAETENNLSEIHQMAETGKSIIEPMKTKKPIVSWDELLIKGAQLAKLPLNQNQPVNTKTIIGPKAQHPLILDIPIYISHMSFGSLSREAKIALAQGSAEVKTAIGSGEGGILPEEREKAYKFIFEYVPNQYSVNEENLRKADAIEIKIGQSTKPGMGGHLPAEKVTEEIAFIRGKTPYKEIHSPSFFKDITTREELKIKIDWLRKISQGKPIGVKIAAGDIEADLEFILYAQPDFITIDGRGGGTGSSPKLVKDSTSVPTLFALYRARKYLNQQKIKGVSLIITGGLRVSSDFTKALCLGADAIAIATSALIAIGCQQYQVCHTGKCPVGIATQDPELRKKFNIEQSTKQLVNFLKVSSEEIIDFARLTGNDDIHKFGTHNLVTTSYEIFSQTNIQHVGGKQNE